MGAAWSAARRILGGEIDAVAVLGIALALAAAWLAALVLAGIAAAARATLVTAELLRRDPAHARGAAAATGGDAGRVASRDGRPARRMSARGLDAADALLHCAACAAGGTPSEHDGARRTEVGDPTAWT